MKRLLITTALAVAVGSAMPAATQAEEINVGVLLGFTGPIESLTPDMARSAELGFKEASDSGVLLGGKTIKPIRGDSTCVDANAATTVAERMVSSDQVVAIYGADCSGVTTAVANKVAIPRGVVMVSPSATSPALTDLDDNGYFFRTAPSDARQGQVLADIVLERGVNNVAITYTNNDYGKGLLDSFSAAFEAKGGTVAASAAHEDGKADYSAEVAALSASGAEYLVVFGYLDQGGKAIIQASLDSGAFDRFIVADGMVGQSLVDAIGRDLDGTFGTQPGSADQGMERFAELAKKAGFDGKGGPFRGESYDAAALLTLAMQAAGSTDRSAIQSKMMMVANAPGEPIQAGEIAKGLKIIADGGDVDYVGATGIEFSDIGEVQGSYKEVEVKGGQFSTVGVH
ncbi:MAG: ABC transporter substrate-binding protein [Gammaproteobacteria bacterium]